MKINIKKELSAGIAFIAIICLVVTVQSFAATKSPSTTVASSTKKFVKTKNKCSKCSCSGYWGYKHQNGTYEGACSNRDRHGYTCGHGPEKHGLKKW